VSIQVLPSLTDTCHSTVGAGVPLAAALKVAVWPAYTLWLSGFVVMAGRRRGSRSAWPGPSWRLGPSRW
jgi:hypothetical protein